MNYDNESELCERIYKSATKVVFFLESRLEKNGSYGTETKDLACYFKSPMMFIAANKSDNALKVLNYIKSNFMSNDGDFNTHKNLKSSNSAYLEYEAYINGWIIRAANCLDITEIVHPGYEYLKRCELSEKKGFLTNSHSEIVDVLTVAHHGLINLELGNLELALSAGHYLCNAFRIQPNLKEGFYLRLDKQGNLLTHFPREHTPFYFINTTKINQLHFMVGYPAAFLTILYKNTKNKDFLEIAKSYLEFSLTCDSHIYECDFSHKIAWAAALIYSVTFDNSYIKVIRKICDYFMRKQNNGMWFNEDINISYDQSAEIACWFFDIVKNLKNR